MHLAVLLTFYYFFILPKLVTIKLYAVIKQGGETLEERPIAMYLRSGDCLIMSGQQRLVYHGVPKVLTDKPFQQTPSRCHHVVNYLNANRINFTVRQVQ